MIPLTFCNILLKSWWVVVANDAYHSLFSFNMVDMVLQSVALGNFKDHY